MAASPGVVLAEAQANASVHRTKSNGNGGATTTAQGTANAVLNSQAQLG